MKVLTIGGAMHDSIAIIESERIERMVMRNADTSFLLLEEGRKTEAHDISTHCGGGAVNTAVSFARLGFDTSTLIKLGKDQRADEILTRLESEGVSTRWVMRDSTAPTGASLLIASHDRNAAVFTFRGANTLLRESELQDNAFAVDLVYISSLSNESADCFPQLVKKAKAQGALVATNPGVRQLSARTGPFYETLSDIDILSINQTEADALVPYLVTSVGEGGPTLPLLPDEEPLTLVARGFSNGGYDITLPHFTKAMLERGLKYVVITAGSDGAFVASQDGLLFCPAHHIDVAGTAGGGDAFASTFAAFITLGKPLENAIKAATLNSASVISSIDTQTGLLGVDQLQNNLKEMTQELTLRHWTAQEAGF
ncbi:MAG: carbohydrate kinase family protein [Pseudomonadota bacterium]